PSVWLRHVGTHIASGVITHRLSPQVANATFAEVFDNASSIANGDTPDGFEQPRTVVPELFERVCFRRMAENVDHWPAVAEGIEYTRAPGLDLWVCKTRRENNRD